MMRTFKKSLPAGKQGNDTTRLGRDTLHRLKTRPETFRSNWRSKACFFRNRLSTKKACRQAGQRHDPPWRGHAAPLKNKKACFFQNRLSTKKGSDILSHKMQYHLRKRA